MIKPASLFPAGGLVAASWVCLFAPPQSVHAQRAEPSPAVVTVVNQVPGTANVEAPGAGENKPDEPVVQGTDTEILASQGATFTSKDRIAVFLGDVRVRDPRFTLACDELTVYLNKTAVGGAAASPAPGASNTPPPVEPAGKGDGKSKDAEDHASGIDHAVAKGHVIIIQKRAPTKPGEEEKLSIGRADTAEFDNKTGDMTLRGTPKVEQNGNSVEALSQYTVMILHRDNSMDTKGPSRTKIIQRPKAAETPGARPTASPSPAHASR